LATMPTLSVPEIVTIILLLFSIFNPFIKIMSLR
jgi:hypothetical protein